MTAGGVDDVAIPARTWRAREHGAARADGAAWGVERARCARAWGGGKYARARRRWSWSATRVARGGRRRRGRGDGRSWKTLLRRLVLELERRVRVDDARARDARLAAKTDEYVCVRDADANAGD